MKTKKMPPAPAASLLLPLLLSAFLLSLPVHAAETTGFLSIDCGGGNYTDATTGITYASDDTFIDSGIGEIHQISSSLKTSSLAQQFLNLRSFPDGDRNCYTIQPSPLSVKFLIRASFMYGNYDGINKLPQFDVQLGVEPWETIQFADANSTVRKEIVHIPGSNYTYICLVNTGLGTPFISAIEVRPLKNDTYVTQTGSLSLYLRLNVGSSLTTQTRYPDDVYDRIWSNFEWTGMRTVNTSLTVDKDSYSNFRPPSKVMSTAVSPQNATSPLKFYWDPADPTTQYYIYMHFAEVESLAANQIRQFNITLNGTLWYANLEPVYLSTTTVYSTIPKSAPRMDFSIVESENSTLPPLLNAIEIYAVKQFSQSQTGKDEVDAMNNIKKYYGVKRNWQGDPCAPTGFVWTGLNCSYQGSEPPHIISLNLSNSELRGEISTHINDLQAIQSLDLSNNALNGTIPDFLAQLPSLKVLNLKGNKFTGPVPTVLLQKSESGSLTLSVDQTSDTSSSNKKSSSIVVPVVAGVIGGLVFIILLVLLVWWLIRKQKKGGKAQTTTNSHLAAAYKNDDDDSIIFENKNRQFTYSDVLKMTNNFEHVIGRGGFGSVFLGSVNAAQVAVKMLSMSSVDGFKQFRSEVRLLMRVHHRNLTSLVGYCDEGDHKALIYEYMINGNLQEQIRDKSPTVLSWEERLRIAVDAAQGLEYLHSGCKPPIVHRDVKSTNILLSETFQAKIADFGLSRVFQTEGVTHVSTIVAGTPGYLDPEYYISNRLNEKSDIFSFGVVILEIITSRSVILRDHESGHISQWVARMLESEGNIESIVDGRLTGDFDVNSAWKALELAMACVSATSSQRPTMAQIVVELKDCLAMAMASANGYNSRATVSSTTDTFEIASLNIDTSVLPLAR